METTTTTADNTSYVLALDADTNRTYRFGIICIAPAEVIHCFGQGSSGDDFKVSRKWKFQKGDLIFTLYDWKSTNLYDPELCSPEEFWARTKPFFLHIGSKAPATDDDAEEFAQFLRETIDLAG